MNYQEQLEKYLESIKDIKFDMSYGHEKKELESEYLANINQARLIEEVLVKKNA